MPAEHHRTFCPGHLRSHFWSLPRNYFQSPKELLLMNVTINACAQGQTSFEDRNHRVNTVPPLPGGTLWGTFLYFLGVLPTDTEPTTHRDPGLHKLLLVWLSPVSCFNLLCTHASFLGVFFQHKPVALKSWSHGLRESCHVTLHNGWLNISLQLKPDSLQWSSGSYMTHPCLSGLLPSLYSSLVALAGSLSWNPFSTPCLRAFALKFFLRFNILQLSKQLTPSFSLKFLSYISSCKPIWLLYLKFTFVFPNFLLQLMQLYFFPQQFFNFWHIMMYFKKFIVCLSSPKCMLHEHRFLYLLCSLLSHQWLKEFLVHSRCSIKWMMNEQILCMQECKMLQPLWRTTVQYLSKLKMYLTSD